MRLGQEFKAHTDYFEAEQYDKYATAMGQRTYTFFIYLNDVEEGGETDFESLGLVVRPRQGSAIVWNNLDANGIPNPKNDTPRPPRQAWREVRYYQVVPGSGIRAHV